jgi:hypothetical protein
VVAAKMTTLAKKSMAIPVVMIEMRRFVFIGAVLLCSLFGRQSPATCVPAHAQATRREVTDLRGEKSGWRDDDMAAPRLKLLPRLRQVSREDRKLSAFDRLGRKLARGAERVNRWPFASTVEKNRRA